MYYPLHVHTALGSVGDSILEISDYVSRAKEYGLKAAAITDHGSLSAMFRFISECRKKDILPIIGMEAYFTDNISVKDKTIKPDHLVLLARNPQGLSNLIKLHNEAQLEGFYYKPRTDIRMLQKYGKGLIALSACVAGSIPKAILKNDIISVKRYLYLFESCFDEFYLEIQPGKFDEQNKINQALMRISSSQNIPLVITNDIHYLNEDDYKRHNIHLLLSRQKDAKQQKDILIYPDKCYWFMKEDDILNSLDYIPEDILKQAIKNTEDISLKCMFCCEDIRPLRTFSNKSAAKELEEKCEQRLYQLSDILSDPVIYSDRLKKEISVITEKGFASYFLIVQDYVSWAEKNNIKVGPGRGSAAGSLVSYLLGITKIDPIKFDLIFERFLDPNREVYPDIDIDFETEGREKVQNYLIQKYGNFGCVQVSTVHYRKAKAAIKDSCRLCGIPPRTADNITKLFPVSLYDDEGNKDSEPDILTYCDTVKDILDAKQTFPEVFDLAIQGENLPVNTGIHAAGILISPENLFYKIPLIKSNASNCVATSLDLEDAEKILIKYDLLALNTLDVIAATEKETGVSFNYDTCSFSDSKVWDLINSKNTAGIFQISSHIYKQRLWRIKPHNLTDLATCLALIRGPCISAGTDEEYMLICEKKRQQKKIDPIYDKITQNTNGILVFQEQTMYLVQEYGLDLPTGYRIVKAAAKKHIEDIRHYRKQFIEAAKKKGCSCPESIFDMIEKSSQYSFNLSHAIAYAAISYASAWFKTYHTTSYMKNVLTDKYSNSKAKDCTSVINDCKNMGISFLLPDINKSNWNFTIEDGKIRVGLCAVKGLGLKAVEHLLSVRGNLPFTSLGDILQRIEKRSFNKNKMIASIFAGLFDSICSGMSKKDIYYSYCELTNLIPEEEISISKDVKFKTNTRAVKSLQQQLLGAIF